MSRKHDDKNIRIRYAVIDDCGNIHYTDSRNAHMHLRNLCAQSVTVVTKKHGKFICRATRDNNDRVIVDTNPTPADLLRQHDWEEKYKGLQSYR